MDKNKPNQCLNKIPNCRSTEYGIWMNMKQRCGNASHNSFKNYGGRGISVCERWKVFANFYTDMGARPKNLTLERCDNNQGYCPENCKWATRAEQRRNSRNLHLLTHDGVTRCVADWESEKGFKPHTIHMRLKLGWSIAEAVETPLLRQKNGHIRKPQCTLPTKQELD